MKDCVFCKIINKEIDSNIIYESNNICCFMDFDPIDDGHVLIVSKKHFIDIDEIDDDTLLEVIRASKLIVKALKQVFKPDGYSIMQNGGAFNDIGHYHVHIFPRFKGDGFTWIDDESNIKTVRELSEIQNKLKKVIEKIKNNIL